MFKELSRNSPDYGKNHFMRQKQSWATAAFLLSMFLIPTVGDAQQQTAMPPRTQDRPLRDRIATMERAQRDEWQKPDEVVKALGLNNGDIVADVGAGSGYFSRRLSRAVGPKGRVYAVDVAADILAYLKDRADQEGLRNIVTIVSQPDDPMLPPNSVDLVFFCDTTHHIDSRVAFYRKLAPAVRQHARMAIIDYPPDSPHAPHRPEQLVPRAQVINEAEQAGFKFVKDFQFLPYHYFLVFEKR
jgi:arsenite methyltransferase